MRDLGGQREWAGCSVPTQCQCGRSDLRASPCTPGVPVHLQGEGTPRGNVLILQLMRAGGLVPTNGQLWGQHLGNSHKGECRDPTTGPCAFLQACACPLSARTAPHTWILSQRAFLPLFAGHLVRDVDWLPGFICSGGDRSSSPLCQGLGSSPPERWWSQVS